MHEAYQQQSLSMHMHMVGGDSCQQPLQDPQFNAIIRDVITSTQQLHGLCLQVLKPQVWTSSCLCSTLHHNLISRLVQLQQGCCHNVLQRSQLGMTGMGCAESVSTPALAWDLELQDQPHHHPHLPFSWHLLLCLQLLAYG